MSMIAFGPSQQQTEELQKTYELMDPERLNSKIIYFTL